MFVCLRVGSVQTTVRAATLRKDTIIIVSLLSWLSYPASSNQIGRVLSNHSAGKGRVLSNHSVGKGRVLSNHSAGKGRV